MNVEHCQAAADPQTKSTYLRWQSACRLLLSASTITIYYYSADTHFTVVVVAVVCLYDSLLFECAPLIITLSFTSIFWCTGWRKKRGHRPSYLIANIPKTPWRDCVEIGGLLQYYMLNTVINFLFKNFIGLWRHLAKTQLLCDAQIYLYNVNKRSRISIKFTENKITASVTASKQTIIMSK